MTMHIPDNIQSLFPASTNCTYFNTSSSGLLSSSGAKKAQKFHESHLRQGSAYIEAFEQQQVHNIKEQVADFIHAKPSDLAFIPNFSYGLSALLPSLLPLKKVLIFHDDYPSLTLPFHLQGFDVYELPPVNDVYDLNIDTIKETLLKHKIKIFAASHVQYLTGYTLDVADIGHFCKEHDIIFILDGTQSIGATPFAFDDSAVDVLILSNYKWMNAGYGTGIMVMSEKILTDFPPQIGGYHSFLLIENNWQYAPSMSSFEPGHQNLSGLAILSDAILLKKLVGLHNILIHNRSIIKYLIERFMSLGVELSGPSNLQNRTNILCIKGTATLADYLARRDIVVKYRNNMIRIGVHFYNTLQDADQLVEVCKRYVK